MYFGGIAFLRVELLRGFSSSENPEFDTTLARHLNQSRVSTVLQSNLFAKFRTAEARRLNWASVIRLEWSSCTKKMSPGTPGSRFFLLLSAVIQRQSFCN